MWHHVKRHTKNPRWLCLIELSGQKSALGYQLLVAAGSHRSEPCEIHVVMASRYRIISIDAVMDMFADYMFHYFKDHKVSDMGR